MPSLHVQPTCQLLSGYQCSVLSHAVQLLCAAKVGYRLLWLLAVLSTICCLIAASLSVCRKDNKPKPGEKSKDNKPTMIE